MPLLQQQASPSQRSISTMSSSSSPEASDSSDQAETEIVPLEKGLLESTNDNSDNKSRQHAFNRLRSFTKSGGGGTPQQHRYKRRGSKSGASTASSNHSRGAAEGPKSVRFDEDKVVVHPLPNGRLCDGTRKILWLTYQDKVTITDDVEEICYVFNNPDEIHPYVAHLDLMWDKCASRNATFTDEEVEQLVHGKGRGLEKKLAKGLKKNQGSVVKAVLDTQKTYRNIPVGANQRAKILKEKYKKLSLQSKVFAQALAQGDERLSRKYNQNTIAALSA